MNKIGVMFLQYDIVIALQKDTVIANPYMLHMNEEGMDINAGLSDEKYSSLWLKYSYDDMIYIIVPNGNVRVDIFI